MVGSTQIDLGQNQAIWKLKQPNLKRNQEESLEEIKTQTIIPWAIILHKKSSWRLRKPTIRVQDSWPIIQAEVSLIDQIKVSKKKSRASLRNLKDWAK